MKYEERFCDLFSVNSEDMEEPYCLAHCISADFGMFGGIVVEFNRRWDMKNRLLQKYGNQRKNFYKGMVFPETVHHNGVETVVYNMVTKEDVSSLPLYTSLEACLVTVRDMMLESGHHKLAIPKIGCGIDRLDWVVVRPSVKAVFEDTDIEVLVCIR